MKVRQALNLAVDRQAIVDSVYKGLAYPYQGYIPVNFPGFEEHHEYDFDLARRRSSFYRGRLPERLQDGALLCGGHSRAGAGGNHLADGRSEIGVDVTLRKLPTAAISALVFQEGATFALWQDAPFLPDAVFSLQLWYTTYGPWHFANDPKIDQGVADCAKIDDKAQRITCAQDLANYIASVAPDVNMTAPYFTYAVSDKVSGANFNFGLSYVVETMSVAQ